MTLKRKRQAEKKKVKDAVHEEQPAETVKSISPREATTIVWLVSASASSINTLGTTCQMQIGNTAGWGPNVMIAQISGGPSQYVVDSLANVWTPLAGPYTHTDSYSQFWFICQGAAINLTAANHTFWVGGPSGAPSMTIVLLRSYTIPLPLVDVQVAQAVQGGLVSGGALTLSGIAALPEANPSAIDSGFTLAERRPGASGQAFGIGLAYKFAPGPTNPVWTVDWSIPL